MAKLSVIEIVQDILSDMNSDEVNSLNDTIESLQVAQIVKSTYFEIINGRQHWPHLRTLARFGSFGDNNLPTHMIIPENIREVVSVEYCSEGEGGRLEFNDIEYVEPDEFLRRMQRLDSTDPNVRTVNDPTGAVLLIRTDRDPRIWTSFNDEAVVFDSHDVSVDAALQSTKTRLVAYQDPVFEMVDNHVPDLPAEAHSYLLAEAKSACFARLKQAADQKSEQQSRRQRIQLHRSAWKTGRPSFGPSRGRRSRK